MIPDLSTVGNIVQAVDLGLLSRSEASDILIAAGFVDAALILSDLLGEERRA